MTQTSQWLGVDSPCFSFFCSSRYTLCISLGWRSISSSSATENKVFPHRHRLLYLLLRHEWEFFLLIYFVRIYQVESQSDLFSEPSHCAAVLFLVQPESTLIFMFSSTVLVCIPFSFFSRFCVKSVSLSSFSFVFLTPCQSWLKISSFEVVFSM